MDQLDDPELEDGLGVDVPEEVDALVEVGDLVEEDILDAHLVLDELDVLLEEDEFDGLLEEGDLDVLLGVDDLMMEDGSGAVLVVDVLVEVGDLAEKSTRGDHQVEEELDVPLEEDDLDGLLEEGDLVVLIVVDDLMMEDGLDAILVVDVPGEIEVEDDLDVPEGMDDLDDLKHEDDPVEVDVLGDPIKEKVINELWKLYDFRIYNILDDLMVDKPYSEVVLLIVHIVEDLLVKGELNSEKVDPLDLVLVVGALDYFGVMDLP